MILDDARAAGPTSYPWLRPTAVAAPLLLLGYGLLRLVDGLDGHRDKGGWEWNVGHVLFLLGILVFAALLVQLRGLLGTRSPRAVRARTARHPAARSPRNGAVPDVATMAGLAGAVAFVWVIVGDLFPRFAEAVETPDLVFLGGPLLFQLGLLTLLVLAVRARMAPVWGPPLVLAGFVAIAVSLDLLPVGAALVLAGLAPLTPAPRAG
ncbi:hypothetical protein [Micromonospora sagamiensis]|uniref:hypothetical protein n=1 Tax=Micromonospora sagamiensis TaxID=47875 RepID=UPI001680D641|nr:hypothetical protein [Micromonospora sagamiensis]BCL15426.1 hypothetical protein GCM10017556_31650 [Micromonospora sagamiensis]